MVRHCKRFFVAIGALLGLLTGAVAGASTAHAYEEQASLDLALGYAMVSEPERWTRHGAGLDVGASIGIRDTVVMRGTLGYALLGDGAQREQIGRLRVEGVYLLDVLELVPFFGLGLTGSTAQHGEAALPLRGGVHLVLGVDYLWSREWNVGVDVRSGLLFEGSALLNATDVGLRFSRMFELF